MGTEGGGRYGGEETKRQRGEIWRAIQLDLGLISLHHEAHTRWPVLWYCPAPGRRNHQPAGTHLAYTAASSAQGDVDHPPSALKRGKGEGEEGGGGRKGGREGERGGGGLISGNEYHRLERLETDQVDHN